MLQKAPLHGVVVLGDADSLAEIADGGGGVAPSAEGGKGGHSGIVPAGDNAFLHQSSELALAEYRVVNAQTGKFDLSRLGGSGDVVDDPVVERAVILIFQRAEGVGDVFDRVADGMGEVVHRIDAPLVAGAVMSHMLDAVDDRVAHIPVAGGEVDFGAQGVPAVLKFACPHSAEKVKALLDGTVAVGTLRGRVVRAAHFLHLFGGQLTDVGKPFFDQLHRVFVGFFKILRREVVSVAPVVAHPVNVVLDGLHKFLALLGGIGVVHAQVVDAAELLGGAVVDAQRLDVSDVQTAVRLRRETGVYRHALKPSAGCDVLLHKIGDEIAWLSCFFNFFCSIIVSQCDSSLLFSLCK